MTLTRRKMTDGLEEGSAGQGAAHGRDASCSNSEPGKVFPPVRGHRCAQPNCEYFCQRNDDDRILRLRHAYAEYVDACEAEGLYPYSFKTFCAKLRDWKRAELAEEQPQWLPGECMLTYWSLLEVGGKRRWAFVAQMMVSDATFVVRSDGRSPSDWMRCCERAYQYLGGVPYVTDCSVFGASSGGATRCVMATLQGFATYYHTVLFGARPKTAKTAEHAAKPLGPKNSSAVLRAIRRELAAAEVDCLEDIDRVIVEGLEHHNRRVHVGAETRWETLERRELPRMLSLPKEPYDMAAWDYRKLGDNYHFVLDGARYSCPHALVGQEVRIRYTDEEVVAYHGGVEVARHAIVGRDVAGRRVSTDDAHRPNGHRWFAQRMDFRFEEMAAVCGDATVKVMKVLLERCRAEGQGYRVCKELIDLRHVPSAVSLEQACASVLESGSVSIGVDAVRAAMGVA